MRVLVTGGAGFIGSHLVDALLDRGAEVTMVDHLRRSPRPWLAEAMHRGAQLHVVDVQDLSTMRGAFAVARPEVVMHLAAQVDVHRSLLDPANDAQINVAGTVAVLEAAREVRARRVMLASTAAVYGDPDRVPTAEDAPTHPLSPYGTSKAAAEWYLEQYRRLYGLSTVAMRMANVYGPRQDPHGEAGVVAIFCGAAAEGGRGTIYGDGRQTRDYVYVKDVVGAWVRAAENDATGAFNVSTGTETSLLELAAALRLECDHAPGRPGEVVRSCLDPAAAQKSLGWRAAVSLEDGLRETLGALRAGSRGDPVAPG